MAHPRVNATYAEKLSFYKSMYAETVLAREKESATRRSVEARNMVIMDDFRKQRKALNLANATIDAKRIEINKLMKHIKVLEDIIRANQYAIVMPADG